MKRALLVLAACSSNADKPVEKVQSVADAAIAQVAIDAAIVVDAKPPDPPRVALGDCAPTAMQFVSGPRPIAYPTPKALRNTGVLGGDLGLQGFGLPTGGGVGIGNIGIRRQEERSTLSIATPVVEGKLDAAIIRRYLKRNVPQLRFCYERQLVENPKLGSGAVNASFVITAIGATHAANVKGFDNKVDECITGVLMRIEYPKPMPSEDGIVKVGVKLEFTSTKPPAIAKPKPKPAAPYVVDARNPLKGHEPALAACLAKSSKPYGVAVVDFTYDAKGAVTAAKAHNLDPEVVPCVEEVAAKATRVTKAATERCSLAFGTMPAADLPAARVMPDKTSVVQIIGPIARDDKPIDMPLPIVPVPITAQGTWP